MSVRLEVIEMELWIERSMVVINLTHLIDLLVRTLGGFISRFCNCREVL
jgi:hypothetical protein